MSVREPGSLSGAHGAYLVVDHFLRGDRLMKKERMMKPRIEPAVLEHPAAGVYSAGEQAEQADSRSLRKSLQIAAPGAATFRK